MLEQSDSPSEQNGHQVNMYLVEKPGPYALLPILAAPTATLFLSPATALACSTALSTPCVTKVNDDPS